MMIKSAAKKMRISRNSIGACFILIGVCSAVPAFATTYYVSTTGNNSNNGMSLTSAWADLGYASTRVGPGDTVLVADGTYNTGSNVLYLNSTGAPGAYVTYKSMNKWGAKLRGQGSGDGSEVLAFGNNHSYNIIEDFDISTTNQNSQGISLAKSGTTTSNNMAIGNYVHDLLTPCDSNGGTGIASGEGDNYNPGIVNFVIADNFITNISSVGGGSCTNQHSAGLYAEVPYTIIANNIVISNVINGSQMAWAIETWHVANHVTVYGNLVIGGSKNSIVLSDDSSHQNDYSTIENNIVINGNIVEGSQCGSHNVIADNLLYNSTLTAACSTPTGTVNGDPKFVNNTGTVSGDYHLLAGSPAIGHGMVNSNVTTDYYGNPYPSSGSTDIGPILYDSSSSPSPSPSSSPTSSPSPSPSATPSPSPSPTPSPSPSVTGAPAAGIAANPTSISYGASSTLSYSSKNCVKGDINGTSVTMPSGTLIVTPATTTTYRFTCYNSLGSSDWGQVSVTVGPKPSPSPSPVPSPSPSPTPSATGTPKAGISASATTISSGGSSTLSYHSTNCVKGNINGTSVAMPSGSMVVRPT